jgi:hypothetical protein
MHGPQSTGVQAPVAWLHSVHGSEHLGTHLPSLQTEHGSGRLVPGIVHFGWQLTPAVV